MTILAATDGSEFSQHALGFAAELAAALRSPLDVCCVVDYITAGPLTKSSATGAPDLLRDDACRALDDAVKICESRNVRPPTHLLEEDVVPGILRCARQVGAHCIIMGTRGRGALRTALFGSVTKQVVHASTIPVIVVATKYRDQEARMLKLIVVAVDGSAAGRRAAVAAFDLARQTAAAVDLCHVIDAEHTVKSKEQDARAKGDMFLDAEAARSLEFGVSASKHVLHGRVSDQLLDFAQAHEADLIALGTHGRSGVNRALLGSVSEDVVRRSPIPVLIVRGEDQDG